MALDNTSYGNDPALIEDEGGIKPADLLENLIEYWKVAVAVAVLVFLIAIGVALFSLPIYTADALIRVEAKKGSALSSLGDVSNALVADTASIVGEIEILRSRNVVSRALESQGGLINVSVANRFPVLGKLLAERLPRGADGLVSPLFGLRGFAWGGEELRFDELRLPRDWIGQPLELVVGDGETWQLRQPSGELLVAGKNGQETSGREGQIFIRIASLRAHPGSGGGANSRARASRSAVMS